MQQPPNQPPQGQSPFWGNYQPPPGFYQDQTIQGYPTVPPPLMPPQLTKKPTAWQNLKTAKRSTKIGIGCGTGLIILMMCLCSTVAYAGFHPVPLAKVPPTATAAPATQIVSIATTQPTRQTTKPTPIPTLKPTDTPQPTATTAPTEVPTSVPTAIPTAVPTAVPTQAPTQAPVPTATPVKTGLYGNPWGYDLNPGNVIYNPPATICDYFPCIASFWSHTNGYVDECVDGAYSHSGGVQGACSRHGGEAQPLYSH